MLWEEKKINHYWVEIIAEPVTDEGLYNGLSEANHEQANNSVKEQVKY